MSDLEQVVQKIVDRTAELEEAVSRCIPDPSIVPDDDENFQEQLLDLQRRRELQPVYHTNCKRDERARQLKTARTSVAKQMVQARAVHPTHPHTKLRANATQAMHKVHLAYCRVAALARIVAEDGEQATDDREHKDAEFDERVRQKDILEQSAARSKVREITRLRTHTWHTTGAPSSVTERSQAAPDGLEPSAPNGDYGGVVEFDDFYAQHRA